MKGPPNAQQTWEQLGAELGKSLIEHGTAAVWRVRNQFGHVTELIVLPADRVVPQPADVEHPRGSWRVVQPDGTAVVLPPEDVIRYVGLSGKLREQG